MFRNILLSLVGAPLFLSLVFAYLAAVVVAAVAIVRSVVAGQNRKPRTRP
jgi:hypothetical protein